MYTSPKNFRTQTILGLAQLVVNCSTGMPPLTGMRIVFVVPESMFRLLLHYNIFDHAHKNKTFRHNPRHKFKSKARTTLDVNAIRAVAVIPTGSKPFRGLSLFVALVCVLVFLCALFCAGLVLFFGTPHGTWIRKKKPPQKRGRTGVDSGFMSDVLAPLALC